MFTSSFSILRMDRKSRGKPQVSFLERHETPTPDDQVVERLDIQELASLDNGLGDGDVVRAGV
jgi:hypothetical protein